MVQESNMNQLELGLGFKGDNGDKSQNAAVMRGPWTEFYTSTVEKTSYLEGTYVFQEK